MFSPCTLGSLVLPEDHCFPWWLCIHLYSHATTPGHFPNGRLAHSSYFYPAADNMFRSYPTHKPAFQLRKVFQAQDQLLLLHPDRKLKSHCPNHHERTMSCDW